MAEFFFLSFLFFRALLLKKGPNFHLSSAENYTKGSLDIVWPGLIFHPRYTRYKNNILANGGFLLQWHTLHSLFSMCAVLCVCVYVSCLYSIRSYTRFAARAPCRLEWRSECVSLGKLEQHSTETEREKERKKEKTFLSRYLRPHTNQPNERMKLKMREKKSSLFFPFRRLNCVFFDGEVKLINM